jgi:hypothetical protein
VKLPCISVRAPWASAIAAGVKTVENRTRAHNLRGLVGVHVSAAWCRVGAADPRIRRWVWGETWWDQPPLDAADYPSCMRCIVAVTNVVGGHRAEPGCCDTEWADYPTAAVRVVHHLELVDTREIDPVGPVRGAIQIPWYAPEDVSAAVLDQIALSRRTA